VLRDGLLLIRLVEQLTGTPFRPRYERRPLYKVQKIANIHTLLRYLSSFYALDAPHISPEEVVEGSPPSRSHRGQGGGGGGGEGAGEDGGKDEGRDKALLALLWLLFERFGLPQQGNQRSPEMLLLEWVGEMVRPFSLSVSAFNVSFLDGRVLLALVHLLLEDEEVFSYEKEVTDSPEENISRAFKAASERLGLTIVISPKLLALGKVDDRLLITLISSFHHLYQAHQKEKESLRRVSRIERELKEKEKLVHETEQELRRRASEIDRATKELEMLRKQVEEQKTKIPPSQHWEQYISGPIEDLFPIISIPFSLEEGLGRKRHTSYHVKVFLGAKVWVVKRRYSNFYELHEQLCRALGKKVVTAKLPGKKALGNMKAEFVSSRRIHLEEYLTQLVTIDPVLRSPIFASFICKDSVSDLVDVDSFRRNQMSNQGSSETESVLDDGEMGWVVSGFD